MGASEVIANEQALAVVSDGIRTYVSTYREIISTGVRGIRANSGDWSDEDFNSIVSAINSFLTDIDSVGNTTNQLVTRIDNKISAIHKLHNMKI